MFLNIVLHISEFKIKHFLPIFFLYYGLFLFILFQSEILVNLCETVCKSISVSKKIHIYIYNAKLNYTVIFRRIQPQMRSFLEINTLNDKRY